MVRAELPGVGKKLVAFQRKPTKTTLHGIIVEDQSFASGRAVEVEGRRFATLSEAATWIAGYETNGWRYWNNADGSPLQRDA